MIIEYHAILDVKHKNMDVIVPQFDHHNDRWESRYCELIGFRAAQGHCNVPDRWPEYPKLARWVMTQRQMLRKEKLSRGRIRRLEAVGFIWSRQEHAWDEMYRRLVKYKSVHRDCKVPSGWKEDPQLGSWVVRQRHRRKRGC